MPTAFTHEMLEAIETCTTLSMQSEWLHQPNDLTMLTATSYDHFIETQTANDEYTKVQHVTKTGGGQAVGIDTVHWCVVSCSA
jgi:hypothetical protein